MGSKVRKQGHGSKHRRTRPRKNSNSNAAGFLTFLNLAIVRSIHLRIEEPKMRPEIVKVTNTNALPDVECVFAGYYVVAFVDLLGTDAKNAEIKAQPEFPVEMLKREVGKVKAFQHDFYAIFDGAAQAEEKLKSLRPENLKADLEELQGNDVNSYAFSDS